MAGLAGTWSNIEVRSVIRFLHQKGTSPAVLHRQLVEVYGANVMSRKQVWFWCTAFDNGRTDVQDEQRPGRPSTSTTDDNLCRIEGLIQDSRIRVSDIADELNISVGDYTYMYELNKFMQ
jgi:histone-lysine N-methyltransferase SETMAR